ncbi:MAG: hypothetical protein PVG75_07840 [Thioalkalispiraceae bacterium]|jgi:hypothetical protein
MKRSKVIAIILIFIPVAIFIFVKPIKIFIPEIAGVVCVKEWLCIDDVNKLENAAFLYESALKDIESKLTPFKEKPKVIFCSTESCFTAFGFKKAAAQSVASFGVVVAPRGWQMHYLKHELIHQWQSDKFGSISVWMAPKWLTEGMAYALSDDPRESLSEPFQGYREKYNNKYGRLLGHRLEMALSDEF